ETMKVSGTGCQPVPPFPRGAFFMTAHSTVLQLDHAPSIDGGEIMRLLAPVTPETFFAEYWNRRPLLIKGSVEKAGQLIPGGFGREDFFRAAHRAAETKGELGIVSAGKFDRMYAPDDEGVLLGRRATDRMGEVAA